MSVIIFYKWIKPLTLVPVEAFKYDMCHFQRFSARVYQTTTLQNGKPLTEKQPSKPRKDLGVFS